MQVLFVYKKEKEENKKDTDERNISFDSVLGIFKAEDLEKASKFAIDVALKSDCTIGLTSKPTEISENSFFAWVDYNNNE